MFFSEQSVVNKVEYKVQEVNSHLQYLFVFQLAEYSLCFLRTCSNGEICLWLFLSYAHSNHVHINKCVKSLREDVLFGCTR